MVSSIYYNGDGSTRIFPVSFKILGDDYIRVYVDDVELVDKTKYDIINNSVVFTTSETPAIGVDNVKIFVATSSSELGDLGAPLFDITNVANNIQEIIDVSESLTTIASVNDNEANINIVANNTPNINTVANDITNVNTVANAINNNTGIGGSGSGGGQFLGASIIKGVQYMANTSAPNETITVTSGLNAFSVDSFTLASGASIVVEDNATYKVL